MASSRTAFVEPEVHHVEGVFASADKNGAAAAAGPAAKKAELQQLTRSIYTLRYGLLGMATLRAPDPAGASAVPSPAVPTGMATSPDGIPLDGRADDDMERCGRAQRSKRPLRQLPDR